MSDYVRRFREDNVEPTPEYDPFPTTSNGYVRRFREDNVEPNLPFRSLIDTYRAQTSGDPFFKDFYGTAGLIAPGHYPGIYGGLQGRLYSTSELWGNDERNATPTAPPTEEYLASRAAFEAAHPGYAQISPDQMRNFRDERGWGFKTAGPSMGQYIIDPSQLKYDPTYGYLSPTSNFGASGSKGSFLANAWPFLLAAGGLLAATSPSWLGAAAGTGAGEAAAVSAPGFATPGAVSALSTTTPNWFTALGGAVGPAGPISATAATLSSNPAWYSALGGISSSASSWLTDPGLSAFDYSFDGLTDPAATTKSASGGALGAQQAPAPVTELGQPAGLVDKLRLNPTGAIGDQLLRSATTQLASGLISSALAPEDPDLDFSSLLPQGGATSPTSPISDAAQFATLPPGIGVGGMTRESQFSGALGGRDGQFRAVRPYNIKNMYAGGGQRYSGAIMS